ncbi:uncharacterized protein BKCO1_1040008 [Diplodia corticola]|uniref:Integrase zinc-binding domain-containing protein n=1 Tax=Diplodia corticola TaxID=236234 RepID=A0A1J9RMR2_9PEZI|nr:uncharacterized protein BKCO1_1040008 [Diplodia corticola]OJD28893.1 hypothetical protein BKCO1_1040008 [Diplodia corticola]
MTIQPWTSETLFSRPNSPTRQITAALCADADPPAEGDEIPEAVWEIRFFLRNGLIYFVDPEDGRHRLCVPKAVEQEVFTMAHDTQHHAGFWRAYLRIRQSILIHGMSRKLREYLKHCPQCQLCTTKRHRPYGELNPIQTSAGSREVQCLDFISKLPPTAKGFDMLLTITCKVTKEILLIKGKESWSAKEWADAYVKKIILYG